MPRELQPRMDYDVLKKGDRITKERIERVYNVRYKDDPETFRLKMLDLREEIHVNRGDLYVRCEGLTIYVMTDVEAAKHRWEQTRQTIARTSRLSEYGSRIDASNFSDAEKKALEHQDLFLATHALSLRRSYLKTNSVARLLRQAEVVEDECTED